MGEEPETDLPVQGVPCSKVHSRSRYSLDACTLPGKLVAQADALEVTDTVVDWPMDGPRTQSWPIERVIRGKLIGDSVVFSRGFQVSPWKGHEQVPPAVAMKLGLCSQGTQNAEAGAGSTDLRAGGCTSSQGMGTSPGKRGTVSRVKEGPCVSLTGNITACKLAFNFCKNELTRLCSVSWRGPVVPSLPVSEPPCVAIGETPLTITLHHTRSSAEVIQELAMARPSCYLGTPLPHPCSISPGGIKWVKEGAEVDTSLIPQL